MFDLRFETALFSGRPALLRSTVIAVSVAVLACGGPGKEREADDKSPSLSTPKSETEPAGDFGSAKQAPPEIVGGGRFVSIHAESFDAADLEKKNLVMQLCQAARVVDDYSYAAKGDDVVLLRGMLSGIQRARKNIRSQLRAKLSPYTAAFWVSHGPEDAWSEQRIKASFIPGELAAAAHTAMEKGYPLGAGSSDMGDLGSNRLEQLEAMLARVRPLVFGETLREQPGDEPPQRPGPEREEYFATMAKKMAPARLLSDAANRNILDSAVRAAAAGTEPALRAYQAAVAQAAPVVMLWLDCPGSQDGEAAGCNLGLGALVAIRDHDYEVVFERVSEAAEIIEAGLPFKKKWKNSAFAEVKPKPLVYEAVCGAGSLGAALLPQLKGMQTLIALGEGDVRVSNLAAAVARGGGALEFRRALLGQGAADRWTKCAAANAALRLAVEEEHAPRSGVMDRGKKRAPGHYLKDHAAVWEKLRVRLMGAVVASGPLAQKLLPKFEPDCAQEVYDDLVMRPVLDALLDAASKDEDARRADRIILNWFSSSSKVGPENGVWQTPSSEAVAESLADLLSYVQKVRSLGIYIEAQKFLEKYDKPIAGQLIARAQSARSVFVERLIAIYPLLERSSDAEQGNDITQHVMTDFLSRERRDQLQNGVFFND